MPHNRKKHLCPCGKEYAHMGSLIRHRKACSTYNSSNTGKKPIVCGEADCKFQYINVLGLKQHLTKEHGFVFTEEEKTFVSRGEFQEWKDDLERDTNYSFYKSKTALRTEGTVEYYYCNRSGQCKVTSSVKCPARMTATTLPDGTVNLCFCSTHYGHPTQLCDIRLPKGDREDIAENIQERKPGNVCMELDCEFRYLTVHEFCHHLRKVHGFVLTEEEKTFGSRVDFQQWKDNLERDTNASFYKKNTSFLTDGTVEYYYCNRSGQYKGASSGIRKCKSQGTCKINTNCTARMKAKTLSDGAVHLYVCYTHYGHDAQLCHIRIPKRDREDIAENLQEGIPAKKIVKRLFASEVLSLERKHLVTNKDISNIASAYRIDRIQRHSEDHISVDSHILEDLEMEKSSVILYKRQQEGAFTHPPDLQHKLNKEDFVLGIMSNFQMKMFQKFGNKIVCLDCTHGTNGYDFHLITILVIDDFSESVPVAWMISNKETTCVLTIFFSQVRKIAGAVSTKVIMSDKGPQYYKSWVNAFDCKVNAKKLLCIRHVVKDWKENLRSIHDKNVADQMYKTLTLLLEEQDSKIFEKLLNKMLLTMDESEKTTSFLEYFRKEWVPCKEQWAKCFRLHSGITTNMCLDRCHRSIKYEYLDGKKNKTVDELYVALNEMAQELARKRLVKLEKGKTMWKVTQFHNRHRKALTLPISLVKQMSSTKWTVSSQITINETTTASNPLVYVVEKKDANCEKPCHLYCEQCKICLHDYSCNCPDSATKSMICKHIHLVVIHTKNSGNDSEHVMDAIMANDDLQCDASEFSGNESPSSSPDHVATSLVGTASVLESLNIGKSHMKEQTDVLRMKQELINAAHMICDEVQNGSAEDMDLLTAARNQITAGISVLNLIKSRTSTPASKSSV
ncbi:uncharacterized protein ACNLHF_026275 isoform 1-T4 [Anomaloglossus baeobatrachus]|uniref:uncharacterized protein LOC142257905 n=1 Tax=Anomaloglossus baeobatrachus TaxID=238106 RepID=UPI003F50892D